MNCSSGCVAVRNTCHDLMVAIEQNNQTLVDEILVSLAHVADRAGYLLPPLAVSPAACVMIAPRPA